MNRQGRLIIEALLVITLILVILGWTLQKFVDFEKISRGYFEEEVTDYEEYLEKSFRRILMQKVFLDAF